MRTIFSIVIVAVVLWFAIANAAVVTLHLFFWDITVSLALLTGVVFLLGFLLGILRLTPGFLRNRSAAIENKRSLSETRKERDALAERSKVLGEQIEELAPLDTEDKGLPR